MFENTMELAENKLLLLYIFHKINLPISNIQITEIVLENSFINYFTLQQYISQLIEAKFLTYIEQEQKNRLKITEKGEKVLNLFKNRISQDKFDNLDSYLKEKINNIKKELTITADYTIEHNNNFIVNLKAVENDSILIDIKVNVASNKQARDLCSKWKNNSSEIYNKVIKLLLSEETK